MATTASSSTSINGQAGPSKSSSATGGGTPLLTPSEDGLTKQAGNGTSHTLGSANGLSQSPYFNHDVSIINHLYEFGFQAGNYADTILHVQQQSYRLHALILSRSPYLVHLMSTSPQSGSMRVIYVDLEHDPEVTQEGFFVALGYLYSAAALKLLRPENARGVLAAACLLGRMDDLCSYAYEACQQSITVETINGWLDFVETIPSSTDGTTTPENLPAPTLFGYYAQRLRDDVLHFLVVTLPSVLQIHDTSPQSNGRNTLLQIFSRVPFNLFKTAVESSTFQIGSDQARFKFAKEAIELRKRGIAKGAGAEETVVLAFGGGAPGASAVHITRKGRKRPLWKVSS
ncbi:uncharacterized protein STEHIDRAFT_166567 [Stereum hirsutum FP-91666 SS1]|uniref:uncharacterized protein n=1 Tax=Stereum hirsutum (strain FP-91666) TaxID=721885 RepID=UPI000440D7FB|nr:uncharacterized protein STEHIDRAFT_166567 [Stereum hirsutum FP-91666 SS1]EIM90369.1 hypothetical protein STEHIDRAFT_166567 [Stereum hirsutum FP-91666 SS1]